MKKIYKKNFAEMCVIRAKSGGEKREENTGEERKVEEKKSGEVSGNRKGQE